MSNRDNHRRLARLLASASLVVMASACALTPKPFTKEEFAAKGLEDRVAMFKDVEPVTRPLTMSDAVARVLHYNLDERAKMMEQALAMGQLDLDRFDMLPKLLANGGYLNRSDHDTVRTRDAVTLEPSLADPSYSTDRDHKVADLTFSWNVLDFGVSWFTAHQNADRALIAEERRRKTFANLVQEVRLAYWRALGAQELAESVAKTIEVAEKGLDDALAVEQEKLRNPLDSLRFQKALLENLRQLEAIQQELYAAKAQLAALINLPPGTDFRLAAPDKDAFTLPAWAMPIDEMEREAFINNPDLREQVYESRIAVNETRKALVRLLPGISFSGGPNYDSNSFLVDKTWTEASARLTFNLVNLISAPSQISYSEVSEQVVQARRLALRMSVLAQVHVARSQYEGAAKQFSRANRLYEVESKLAAATANRQESDAQSVLERVATQTSAIAAELRRYQTFAEAQAAFGRIETTLGIDPLPLMVNSRDLATVSAVVERHLAYVDHPEKWTRIPSLADATPLPKAGS